MQGPFFASDHCRRQPIRQSGASVSRRRAIDRGLHGLGEPKSSLANFKHFGSCINWKTFPSVMQKSLNKHCSRVFVRRAKGAERERLARQHSF
jgi:hypothetical protein